MIMCFGALMMIWDDAVNVETTNFGMDYRKDQRYTKTPPNLKEGSPVNPYINPEDLYEGYTSFRFGPNVVHWAYHIGWLGLNYLLALMAYLTSMIAQRAYRSRIDKIYERGKDEWKKCTPTLTLTFHPHPHPHPRPHPCLRPRPRPYLALTLTYERGNYERSP